MTAAQVREVVTRLIKAGQHKEGDPDILVVFHAGYDVTRLAFLLADLPVELLSGSARTGCCTSRPAARPQREQPPVPARSPTQARRARHLARPAVTTVTQTTRYGTAMAQS